MNRRIDIVLTPPSGLRFAVDIDGETGETVLLQRKRGKGWSEVRRLAPLPTAPTVSMPRNASVVTP